MTTLTVSLPEHLQEFIDAQVAEGGFSTASDYIRDLVWQAQRRKAKEEVEALLREGRQSGAPMEVTREYWDEKHRRLMERHPEGL